MPLETPATCDVAIVGGGAAGLAAAIFAAEAAATHSGRRRLSVVVLDGARRIGAKILVSGGGRCNVTNESVSEGDFNGPRHLIRHVLAAFDVETTRRWFTSLGVRLKCEEGGKLYPDTDRARTVVDALLDRSRSLGVTVVTTKRVNNVSRSADSLGFRAHHDSGVLTARCLIMATGGRSLSRTGSDGSGWEIVRRLGHTVTDTYPALVPLILQAGYWHARVSGIACSVELATTVEGKLVDRRAGSLLWTHFGISGPVVMDASRFWVGARARGARPVLRCNFFPGEGFDDVDRRLVASATARPRMSLSRSLALYMPGRLAEALVRTAGLDPAMSLARVTRAERRRLVHALSGLVLPVERDRGWDHAEVTAGGVPLTEVDYSSMESGRVPGLYLAGEMLDCDGRIGGFNFQWAWSTGFLAGRAAARSCGAATPG